MEGREREGEEGVPRKQRGGREREKRNGVEGREQDKVKR